jgi:hypothetical protein
MVPPALNVSRPAGVTGPGVTPSNGSEVLTEKRSVPPPTAAGSLALTEKRSVVYGCPSGAVIIRPSAVVSHCGLPAGTARAVSRAPTPTWEDQGSRGK